VGELKPVQLESGKDYEIVAHVGQEFYYPEEAPTTLGFEIFDRLKNKVMTKFSEPLPIQKRVVKIWWGKDTTAYYFTLNMQPRFYDSEDILYRIKLKHKGKPSQLLIRMIDTKGGCAQPVIK
jgi:hypothetical protein